jgi:MYXO-CTERM domain-containing protein
VPTPPEVAIVRPRPGEAVDPGFPIEVSADDDNGISVVRVFVDGRKIAESTEPPFIFNAPTQLGQGGHVLRAEAEDRQGTPAMAEITFIVGEPCAGNSDCGDAEACVEGRCVPDKTQPGGFGSTCDTGTECASGLCGNDGSGTMVCTELCDLGASGCPGGYECRNAGSNGVCWPLDGGGGCAVADDDREGPPTEPLALVGLGLLLAVRRRRR